MRHRVVKLAIGIVVLLVIAPHHAADAQPAAKRWRIGWLDQGSAGNSYFEAFRQGLHDLGWTDGQNVTVEARFAEGRTDRLPMLAAELVRLKVDVIATSTTPAALAAKQATAKIPIVFGGAADPIGSKIVSSLARPDGNITGWTHQGLELRANTSSCSRKHFPRPLALGSCGTRPTTFTSPR